MYIYVASSWRNEKQPVVVAVLRQKGFEVYDFRNPTPGDHGFHWSEISPDWESWNVSQYLEAIEHPIAESGFARDIEALKKADACILVLPAGVSASLEFGHCVGAGKRTAVIHDPTRPVEPELMLKMADFQCHHTRELVEWLR